MANAHMMDIADNLKSRLEDIEANKEVQELKDNEDYKDTLSSAKTLVEQAETHLRSDDDTELLETFKKLFELHAEHIEYVTFDAFWLPEHQLRKFIRDAIHKLLDHPVLKEKYEWDTGDEDGAYAGIASSQFGYVKETQSQKQKKKRNRK
jgi:hypothetical protein